MKSLLYIVRSLLSRKIVVGVLLVVFAVLAAPSTTHASWIKVRNSDGAITGWSRYDSSLNADPGTETLIDLGVEREVNRQTQKWNGSAVVDRTAEEVAAYESEFGSASSLSSGAFSYASDQNLKENFTQMNPDEILSKILTLPVTRWNYKTDSATTTHIGPVAQDFYSAFGLGGAMGSTTISVIDPSGIALLGIKALNTRIDSILNGTATSTITNIAYLNATTTTTGELCLGGDCRTSWPAASAPPDLSGYALLTAIPSIANLVSTTTLASTLSGYATTASLAGYATTDSLAGYATAANLASATSSLAVLTANVADLTATTTSLNTRLSAVENEITALAGGDFGISTGFSSPGLGTLASIAKWSFSSSTPANAVENLLKPAAGIEPAVLGIPSPGPDPLAGYFSSYSNLAVSSLIATSSVWTNGLGVLGNGYINNLTLGSGGLTFTDGSTLASANGFVSTTTLATTLIPYVRFSDLASTTAGTLSGTITGNLIPNVSNAYAIGSMTNKLSHIYAQNVIAGDLGFSETTSAMSGSTLVAGDVLALYVSATGGSCTGGQNGTCTIPIDFRTAINTAAYGANNLFFNTSGSLAIGIASTTAPRGKLDVEGSIASGDARFLTLSNTSGANGNAALAYSMYIPSTTGDLNFASNDNNGALINTSYSAWNLKLGGQTDTFSIQRSPTASLSYANLFNIASSGNVGIGSSTPWANLSIAGSSAYTGKPLFAVSSSTPTATTTAFLISSQGKVGIGTTSPSSLLSVQGNSYTSGTAFFGGAITATSSITAASLSLTTALPVSSGGTGQTTFTASQILYGNGTAALSSVATTSLSLGTGLSYSGTLGALVGGASGSLTIATSSLYSGTTGQLPYFSGTNTLTATSSLFLATSGNVGIGTTSPAARLHVQNTSGDAIMRIEGSSTNSGYINFRDANGTNSNIFIGSENSAGGNILSNSSAYNAVFGTANARGLQLGTNNAVRLTIDSSGNVGIGTTTPNWLLQVSGTRPSFALSDASASANQKHWLFSSMGGNLYIGTSTDAYATSTPSALMILNNGNVGIGTSNPGWALEVSRGGTSNPAAITLRSGEGQAATISVFADENDDVSDSVTITKSDGGNLDISNSGGAASHLVITTAGNLLIGTASAVASTKLEVTGGDASILNGNILRVYNSGSSHYAYFQMTGTGGSTVAYFSSNDAGAKFQFQNQTNVNVASDGTLMGFFSGSVQKGSISVSGETVSYNAFTGSHYGWIANGETIDRGMVVSLTGDNRTAATSTEIIYGITRSSTPNDSKVFGTYLSRLNPGRESSLENPELIMAVGNGEVWAVDMGSNLSIGDYLISSGVLGHAMKEDGTYSPAYVIARVAEPVNWAGVTATVNDNGTLRKHKKISVTFENFVARNLAGITVDNLTGNVGIGTTTPNHTLTVVGDVAAIAFVNTSTRTAKTDISYDTASSSEERLNQLVDLKVATYRYTIEDQQDPLRLGFIAEDAQTIAPEILSPDGKGVDIYKLATFTLSGVQALAAKVNAQNTRLTALEERVTALENGSISTASGSPISLSTTSLASAFNSFGILIEKGIAQFNTLVFRQLVASKDADGTSSAGSVLVLAGNTVAQVNNSLVAPTTKVFVTFNSQIAGSWWVSDKTAGSFRVVLSAAQPSDVSFDYFLVQTEGQLATSTPSSNLEVGLPSGTDTTPPVITLLGDNPVRLSVGGVFVEPGITVADAGDPAASYVTYVNGIEQEASAATIDTSTQTTYIITYSATDARGNLSTATRSVIVGSDVPSSDTTASSTPASTDTTAPVVTLTGAAAMQITTGGAFTDPGATATDDTDGDLTSSIVVSGAVDAATAGIYTLTYTATDVAGNSSSASRVVTVAETSSSASSSSTATSTTP